MAATASLKLGPQGFKLERNQTPGELWCSLINLLDIRHFSLVPSQMIRKRPVNGWLFCTLGTQWANNVPGIFVWNLLTITVHQQSSVEWRYLQRRVFMTWGECTDETWEGADDVATSGFQFSIPLCPGWHHNTAFYPVFIILSQFMSTFLFPSSGH